MQDERRDVGGSTVTCVLICARMIERIGGTKVDE